MGAIIINLFGGPGSGKSTVASGLVYALKCYGVNVEFASEWIKDKVFEGTKYPFVDECYTFAKQNKKLRQMVDKCDVIITDSPLPLAVLYNTVEPMPIFGDLVMTYFRQYDNLNYMLVREHEYSAQGRMQATAEEADKLQKKLEEFLSGVGVGYKHIGSINAVTSIYTDLVKMGKVGK